MVVGCPVLVLIAATNNGIIMNIKIAAITPLPLILGTVTQFPRKHLTHCLRYSEVLSAIFQCHISQKSVHCHSNTSIVQYGALDTITMMHNIKGTVHKSRSLVQNARLIITKFHANPKQAVTRPTQDSTNAVT